MKTAGSSRQRATPNPAVSSRGEQFLWVCTLLILVLMPFHSFFYTAISVHLPTWAGSLLKVWKELLICVMAVVGTALLWRRPGLAERVFKQWTTWLILAFAVLHLIVALAFHTAAAPAILAMKINLIFLGFYVLAQIAADSLPLDARGRRLTLAIIIPGTIVGAFGVAQMFLLPTDFLTHFGYGPSTILPYSFIQESQIVRIISTLWGPNQLASYLIIPISFSLWLVLAKRRWWALVTLGLSLVTMYGSYSRAGWIAAAVAIMSVVWLWIEQWWVKLALLAAAIIIAVGGWLALPNLVKSGLSYDLLHSSPAGIGGSTSSDLGHQTAITRGLETVKAHPLAAGLEAAGRASDYETTELFTENFYLQIAVQTGLEGLALFLAILIVVGWQLAKTVSRSSLALPLLAAFISLSVMNLFHHTWSDGATALIWWGAAGAWLGLDRRRSQEEYV